MKVSIWITLSMAVLVSGDSSRSSSSEAGSQRPGFAQSAFGQYSHAAIADDAGPCSAVGVDILEKKGGSAVDAAIATMVCVGVVNAHSSGVGGGHFMTIYATPKGESEKVLNTILARERAPQAATADMYVNDTTFASVLGGLAIGVPGEVKGFYRAWQKFGRVPWSELFEASINLCINGHVVNSAMARAIGFVETQIRADPSLSELLLKADGNLLVEGDILKRPKLAVTLQRIADDPEAFYDPNSQLAQDIIADIQERNGIITPDDLNLYDVYDKDPVSVSLQNGDYKVYGPVPPSSGSIIGYMLNILDGYDFKPDSIGKTSDSILTYHRMAEAFKFAYAKRSALGDEGFWDVAELLTNLTSNSFADETRAKITDDTTQPIEFYEPLFDQLPEDSGTAHACILAEDGSAVAITSTINLFFGSLVRGSRTGIFFNNEMDDFSTPGLINSFGIPPSPSNFIEPYKMPMSSMSPTLVLDKKGVVRFIAGGAGGTRITTATAQVIMNALWFGMRNDEANDAFRIHHQLVPNELRAEQGFDQAILDGLQAKGHVLDVRDSNIAVVQSIHNTCKSRGGDNSGDESSEGDRKCIHAASDGRKAGRPDGY